MDKSLILAAVREYVATHHAHDYSGHDFEHIKRVVASAQQIAQTEPEADKFIVELAAWLHDVDDYKQGNGETHHAAQLLDSLALSSEISAQVLLAIDSIGFSKTGYNPQLPSLEAKILYDADKLDGIGAIGIARTFAYGGNKKRPLFLAGILPPDELDLETYAKNSLSGHNHSLIHFFEKLLKLSKLMQTSLGQELAQERQQTMINYLQAFFSEQNLPEWKNLLQEYA